MIARGRNTTTSLESGEGNSGADVRGAGEGSAASDSGIVTGDAADEDGKSGAVEDRRGTQKSGRKICSKAAAGGEQSGNANVRQGVGDGQGTSSRHLTKSGQGGQKIGRGVEMHRSRNGEHVGGWKRSDSEIVAEGVVGVDNDMNRFGEGEASASKVITQGMHGGDEMRASVLVKRGGMEKNISSDVISKGGVGGDQLSVVNASRSGAVAKSGSGGGKSGIPSWVFSRQGENVVLESKMQHAVEGETQLKGPSHERKGELEIRNVDITTSSVGENKIMDIADGASGSVHVKLGAGEKGSERNYSSEVASAIEHASTQLELRVGVEDSDTADVKLHTVDKAREENGSSDVEMGVDCSFGIKSSTNGEETGSIKLNKFSTNSEETYIADVELAVRGVDVSSHETPATRSVAIHNVCTQIPIHILFAFVFSHPHHAPTM